MADSKKPADVYLPEGPKVTGFESFKRFLWDPEKKAFLGRTGLSWAKIGIFYLIFYACLVAFFSIMLWVFYQTLDAKTPKWTLSSSIIGTNPGVGFRPMPSVKNVESTLIWFRHGSSGNWGYWAQELNNFLKSYEHPVDEGGYLTTCSFDRPAGENQACQFGIEKLQKVETGYPNDQAGTTGACKKEDSFGYERGNPCILLKLNKIFDWVPDYYNNTEDMDALPKELQTYIRALSKVAQNRESMETEKPDRHRMSKLNVVWVTCEGENPADVENMGPVRYYPQQGFPGYYFPYRNVPGYLSPLVAVQFFKPKQGVLINIECKAWAKNIKHDRMERRGAVHFELLID